MTATRFNALWGLFLLVLLGCAPGGSLIQVSVCGLADGMPWLETQVSYLDQGRPVPGTVVSNILPAKDRFELLLDHPRPGAVQVRVAGLDAGRCQIAAGQGSVTVGQGGDAQIEVVLAATPGVGCRLVVVSDQWGAVQEVQTAGEAQRIDCGTKCSAPVQRGTTIDLQAQASAEGLFVGWTGGCTGKGACQVTVGAGTTVVSAHFASREVCGNQGWCWEHPSPEGLLLTGVWGSSPDDVWAVGDSGGILHFTGSFWSQVNPGVVAHWRAVWGTGPDDVWVAGGNGQIVHWKGDSWEHIQSGTGQPLVAIYGDGGPSTPGRVWFVGAGGTILRYEQPAPVAAPAGACHLAPAPGAGTIAPVASPTGADLLGVWSSGPQDVWVTGGEAGGDSGVILHWDGAAWQTVLKTPHTVVQVWGSGPEDIWFVGNGQGLWHRQGGALAPVTAGVPTGTGKVQDFLAVHGTGPDEVWIAGSQGAAYRIVAGVPQAVYSATAGSIYGLWGSGAGDVWGVGVGGTIVHWNGSYWTNTGSGEVSALNGVTGCSADDVWAVGDGGLVLRRQDAGWMPVPALSQVALAGATCIAPDDVWMVGNGGRTMRWDGTTLGTVPGGTKDTLLGVWGLPGGDVWTVGGTQESTDSMGRLIPGHGTIVRWRRGGGTNIPDPPIADRQRILRGVWGHAADDIWAVGGGFDSTDGQMHDLVLHWDGQIWSTKQQDQPYILDAIWGSGPSDVWMAGGVPNLQELVAPCSGMILHWDGSSLSPVSTSGLACFVRSLQGTGSTDVRATDDRGNLIHFDGRGWEALGGLTSTPLNGVWSADPEHTWIVGADGAILHD